METTMQAKWHIHKQWIAHSNGISEVCVVTQSPGMQYSANMFFYLVDTTHTKCSELYHHSSANNQFIAIYVHYIAYQLTNSKPTPSQYQ